MEYFSNRKYDRGTHRIWSFAVVAPFLLFAVLLSACTGPSVNEEPNTVAWEKTAESATVDEILSDPNAFYGLKAAVMGRVTEDISPLAFELDGERNEDSASTRYGDGADGLLVIKDPERVSGPEIEVGQTVRVLGEVQSFDVGEVEEQTGADLADGVFTYWASRPSMVAVSVEPVGGSTAP